ncbi:MAG: hypothetical protein HC817_00695 [Saprospiraceae bacterium]|nr:hypothetical protein [Saprospiraceae bacterium]
MALSKKPTQIKTSVSEETVTALINKGGSVPAVISEKSASEKTHKKVLKGGQVPIQLRLTPEIVDVIDELIGKKIIPVSRHSWFMNAIAEQIKREQTE